MEEQLKVSKYEQYKTSIERWRKANQEHVNKYYREKRRLEREKKTAEKNRLIALEYIQQQLNFVK